MKQASIRIFGIPNCDTMKKARKWLVEHDIEHEFHDYRKAGIDEERLRDWIAVTGWEILLNRRGTTWRNVPQETKDNIDEATAIELMLDNPSIIKRPVLTMEDRIEVGFKPELYAGIFA
ncbi:ArsC family reductase [Granulosicoccus sp. 3-233]|uniref:ArsC family reductase n=1 Tax=Granulosicoccus sp. 3-233 TaxID=3417969 RepID=UPI003D353635